MGFELTATSPFSNSISLHRIPLTDCEQGEGKGKEQKNRMRNQGEDVKGLAWKLPHVNSKQLGKLGPAFGLGAGCGLGIGIGLLGGVGFGPGIPGLQVGIGFGAGCGIGLGFGYGVGRGIAVDENGRHSNVGHLSHGSMNFPSQDEIGAFVDELVINTKKIVRATSREIDKWRR